MDISDLAPSESEESNADLPPISTTAEFSLPEMPTASASPPSTEPPPATAAELATLFAGPELEMPRVDESDDASRTPAGVPGSADGRTFEEEPYDPTIGRMLELSSRTSSDALLPDLMMTESGAELLREQGHIDQAIYVYRHLAAKNPDDTSYAERIEALERGAHSSIPLIASISEEVISAARNRPHASQSIRSFFSSFASRRPPEARSGEAVNAAPATEATTRSAPQPQSSATASASEPQSSPTASAPEPTAPEAAASPSSPEPPETVSDDDRSALESLFSGKPQVAASDERAATALASAFSEEFTNDASGPAGQPTRAASDALSLDAVFQSTRSRGEGDRRASQPHVSFDEFFANRENGNGATETNSDAGVKTASLGDDSQSDLELFHEWLDGLKK